MLFKPDGLAGILNGMFEKEERMIGKPDPAFIEGLEVAALYISFEHAREMTDKWRHPRWDQVAYWEPMHSDSMRRVSELLEAAEAMR